MPTAFNVLYTHQKTKKRKTWQDGKLVCNENKKCWCLYNDTNECIDSVNHKSELKIDDALESSKYMITIESLREEKDKEIENKTIHSEKDEKMITNKKWHTPIYPTRAIKKETEELNKNITLSKFEKENTDLTDADILASLLTGKILRNEAPNNETSNDKFEAKKIKKSENEPFLPHIPSSDKTKILSILQSFNIKPKLKLELSFSSIESYSKYLTDSISNVLCYTLENSLDLSRKILTKIDADSKISRKWIKEKHSDSFIYFDCRLTSTFSKKPQFNLKLSDIANNDNFSSDDLWILSKDLNFTKFLVVSSNCYRPNNDNEILINLPTDTKEFNCSNTSCHAIHVGNVFNEFACFYNIQSNLTAQKVPLLEFLLCKTKTNFEILNIETSPDQELIIKKYCLQYGKNQNMKDAILKLGRYFCLENQDAGIICIQGVFGSGKSELIAICCIMLDELLSQNNSKILVSALTNIAVDNVMLKLERLNYTEFERIGIQNKIHPSLRKKRTKSNSSSFDKGSHIIDCSKSARIYGVTCASAVLSKLESTIFDYIFIDEATQVSEAYALNSILPFNCKKLVLIGDTKQLGPVVHSKSSITWSDNNSLFTRMIKYHSCPIVLNTQYRCHPQICAISNQLFYSNIIVNGNGNEDNIAPRIPSLPAISFIDTKNGELKSQFDGSWYNKIEAEFIANLILKFQSKNIEPAEIGVISFYKAQCEWINKLLEANQGLKDNLKISTVDAFQGAEKEIIILSCTRDKPSEFMRSDQRINVAITRAKRHLILVGNKQTLSTVSPWSSIIKICNNKDNIYSPQSFLSLLTDT